MQSYNLIISQSLHNYRIDKALSLLVRESRSTIQKAIKLSNVLLNNKIISDSDTLVKENDTVQLKIIPIAIEQIEKTEVEFEIVFEDEALIVINKPPGLTVHPGAGNYHNTLASGLLYYTSKLSDIGGMTRPGIVHRLDKDTSGLLVVAKNNIIHELLAKKIQDRSLVRKYKALVWGVVSPSSGMLNYNIARSKLCRKRMATTQSGGKEAITFYNTDQVFLNGKISLLTCKLQTGRTHQIRVHLSHIGHSIIGDQTYGNNSRKIASLPTELKQSFREFKRQALHSYYIAFNHPISNQFLEFETDLPDDIKILFNHSRVQ